MQLREQLWRTFDLSFTKAELGALVDSFDLDGDGTVDGPEFLSLFFRLQKREQAFLKQQDKALALKELAKKKENELRAIKKEEEVRRCLYAQIDVQRRRMSRHCANNSSLRGWRDS